MPDVIIFSRRQAEQFTPPGSDRAYTLAPLTFRERQDFLAALSRDAGILPDHATQLDALRTAVRDVAPANLAELLAAIDTAEGLPLDPANPTPEAMAAQSRLVTIEIACADAPGLAALRAARQRYMGLYPYIAAQHALRGWQGPGLPPFARQRGVVPDALLEVLPDDELQAVGWRAVVLMRPDQSAEKNSEAPLPLSDPPKDSPAA